MNVIEKAYRERLTLEFNRWCGESDINLDDFLGHWEKRMIIDWWIAKFQAQEAERFKALLARWEEEQARWRDESKRLHGEGRRAESMESQFIVVLMGKMIAQLDELVKEMARDDR